MDERQADVAVLIGRFQPFHRGHAGLLACALAAAPRVVVVLGSAFRARSPKNPFTWEERAEMIAATLTASERARVAFAPVRDLYCDAAWSRAVRAAVRGHVPDAAGIALVGHRKDASSAYLALFPEWRPVHGEPVPAIDATFVRRTLFGAGGGAGASDDALERVGALVPRPVHGFLRAWTASPAFAALAEEFQALEKSRRAWEGAPYPPTFVTVDALVRAAGHVLLVQRGRAPGKGLWALPGGFLDPHERLLAGALRELREETGMDVTPGVLAGSLAEVRVFDYPDRSLRGRTVTHVHRFELGGGSLPPVEGADDAAQAAWVPVGELTTMEDAFFEDHFYILATMLGLHVE